MPAEKNKPFQAFTFSLDEQPAEKLPDPEPALEKFFTSPLPAQPAPPAELPMPESAPLRKGGRPKGPPKIKRSYYLAYDLSRFETVRLNTAVNGGVMVKDDGETVDLALELLDFISRNPDLSYLIKQSRGK